MFRPMKKALLSVAMAMLVLFAATPNADAGAASNYLVNKLLDAILRGQTYTFPTTVYVALATTTGSSAACGTEATYTGYARVPVTSSLANWAATQGATTTAVSTGTSGTTSNNASITFGADTSGTNTVVEFCVYDASTSGNLLFRAALTSSQTINVGGSAPSFAVSALTWTIN